MSNPIGLSYFDNRIAQRAFKDDFKIPSAGLRLYSDGNLNYQGSDAYLWSSSPYGTHALHLHLDSTSVDANIDHDRTTAHSVRCFKDSVLVPSLYSAQVKFQSNGATSVGKVFKVDDVVIAPSITRYGYEILGWSIDSGAITAQYLV